LYLIYRKLGIMQKNYNVLFLVIDDLRSDHMRAHGYERATTPNLDQRMAKGTVFTQCFSPVGWTLPACASIVTGYEPDDHGLSDHNQRFNKSKLGEYLGARYYSLGIVNNGNLVPDSISPEVLDRLGFARRPAKWKFFGWDQGFDRYLWTHREDHLTPFQQACDFLDSSPASSGGKPWFLFFHTNIVHDYHMDRKYYLEGSRWLGEEIHPLLRSISDGPEIWRTPVDGLDHEAIKRHLIAKYDAGIQFMDLKVNEILSRVNFDETIVVFVSDHGEGFEPEIGRVHHCGRLHNDLTHIPLIIWLPDELRSRYAPPEIEDRRCSTIDIVPTILTLLGEPAGNLPGHFLFDLTAHRAIRGSDRGYIYWNEDCVRESYDTSKIEIRSELIFPLKHISARKDDEVREYVYNLADDPGERVNLRHQLSRAAPNFEPITFVVAINDTDELHHNLLNSPIVKSPEHEWILVENHGNSRYPNISCLYEDALRRASNDLVFFMHQDLFLPEGWEEKMFAALLELETLDPEWGVLGAVGVTAPLSGSPQQLVGHWCDPNGYYSRRPLPREVQSLDEQWLGLRKRRGLAFDEKLPGFHCYGIDISLTARQQGLKSYAIDAFVWHKYRDSKGHLIARREDSSKILQRRSHEFKKDFLSSAEYVERKWKMFLPFCSTSMTWPINRAAGASDPVSAHQSSLQPAMFGNWGKRARGFLTKFLKVST
jgi:arylsulfatase A-like enzyme